MNVEFKPELAASERAAVVDFHARSLRSHMWQEPRSTSIYLQNGRQVLHILGTDARAVVCHGIVYVDRWRREAFCMRGPVFDREDVARRALQRLCEECEKRGVGQLRISPYWSGEDARTMVATLEGLGFKPYYPKEGPFTKTARVALDDDMEKVFHRFSHETRRQVSVCSREGFQIARIVDPAKAREGHALTERMNARRALSPTLLATFDEIFASLLSKESSGAMVGAYRDGRLVGTCWFVKANHAGAIPVKYAIDNEFMRERFRSLTIGVPIFWEGMKWAKEQGCKWFDLEGYDENTDQDSSAYHIHRFKHRFHPEPIDIVAEHIKVCNPMRYGLYRSQKIWRKLRISGRAFVASHFRPAR